MTNMTRSTLSLIALTFSSLLPSSSSWAQTAAPSRPASSSYSLKTVEENPIPRDEHFLLWREVALKSCADSRKRFNLSEAECVDVISKRADSCAAKLAPSTPNTIYRNVIAREVGRRYLQCATPYYFCNDFEAKTVPEVIAHCAASKPSPPASAASNQQGPAKPAGTTLR
jgi:hypothetical protein